jgi:hypothetical protein
MGKHKTTLEAERLAGLMPSVPAELLEHFAQGPLTAETINSASLALKKALKSQGAWGGSWLRSTPARRIVRAASRQAGVTRSALGCHSTTSSRSPSRRTLKARRAARAASSARWAWASSCCRVRVEPVWASKRKARLRFAMRQPGSAVRARRNWSWGCGVAETGTLPAKCVGGRSVDSLTAKTIQ